VGRRSALLSMIFGCRACMGTCWLSESSRSLFFTIAPTFSEMGGLSIIIAAGGAYPGDLLTASVYPPTTLNGNYLNVRLVGAKSNWSAIGARITLFTGETLADARSGWRD
jgi:hypothetical protein